MQLWGMPEHYKTIELGRKIGEKIGAVEEAGIFSMKGREVRIVKVKVSLDVTKVLKEKVKIAGPNKQVVEIALK